MKLRNSLADSLLKKGDTVTVDFYTCYQYYWAVLSRNFFIGELSEQWKDIYKIVLEANMPAIDVVKPGIPAKMIDQAARDIIEKHGYGEMFLHRTGLVSDWTSMRTLKWMM